MKPLLAMLAATGVSAFGTAMTMLSIPWFVLHTTGSAALTGLVAAAETIALTLSAALSGPLVDQVSAAKMSVLSDLVAAVAVGVVPLLYAVGLLPLWALVLLVVLLGLSRAPGNTAKNAMLPVLADRGATPMERATSGYGGMLGGGRMLGAVGAGSLIALMGPAQVLLVDAATFGVSAVAVLLFVRIDSEPTARPRWSLLGHLSDFRDGFAYLGRMKLLASIVVMVMLTNALDGAYVSVLLPTYSEQVAHSSVVLGVLVGTGSLAGLAGVGIYGWIGHRLPRWTTFVLAFVLAGTPRLVAFATQPELPLLLAAIVVTGFAGGAIGPILDTEIYRRVPTELRGRMFGVISAGVLAGMPLGALLGGVLVDLVGLTGTWWLVAGIYLAATLCPLLFPVWRQLDTPVPVTV